MTRRLRIAIQPQPDDYTCGPTCLHAVYRYYGDCRHLADVIREVPALDGGGTLAVHLGRHALRRGYATTLYTCNLHVFDPTWFGKPPVDVPGKLRMRRETKHEPKQKSAIDAYLDYLQLGGLLRWSGITPRLLRRHLARDEPMLTGLSATYLYQGPRERTVGGRIVYDDVRGEPAGHFVVIAGYDKRHRTVRVVDPYEPNPMAGGHEYDVGIDRLVAAIYLGILTYDANLLVLHAPDRRR